MMIDTNLSDEELLLRLWHPESERLRVLSWNTIRDKYNGSGSDSDINIAKSELIHGGILVEVASNNYALSEKGLRAVSGDVLRSNHLRRLMEDDDVIFTAEKLSAIAHVPRYYIDKFVKDQAKILMAPSAIINNLAVALKTSVEFVVTGRGAVKNRKGNFPIGKDCRDASGKRLARLRQDKGMTRQDVIAALNVCDSSVVRWETHNGLPLAGKICDIASMFDTTVAYIMFGERKVKPSIFLDIKPYGRSKT